MSKHYTQSTAALKTVTIDTTKLDAQNIFIYPGEGEKSSRENLIDIIDDVREVAEQAANVRYLDARGEDTTELDAWGSTITVSVNDEDTKLVTHNDNWVELKGTFPPVSRNLPIQIENNKIYFDNDEVINVETEKLVAINGYEILPSIPCSKTCKFANLQYVFTTTDEQRRTFGKENEYVYSLNLPSLKGMIGGYVRCGQVGSNPKFGLKITAPNLTYINGTFVSSNIERYHGSTENLLIDENGFVGCNDLIDFNCCLPKLCVSNATFSECHNLTSFTSSLNSLLRGVDMFKNCQLNLESVRKIAQSLPNVKDIEEGVKVVYDVYMMNGTYQMGGVIPVSDIGQITISWHDLSFPETEEDTHLLSEDDRAVILYELFPLMQRKGWTISTNLTEATMINPDKDEDYEGADEIMMASLDEELEPLQTSHYYKAFKKMSDGDSFVDVNGEKYEIFESECVIGPKKSEWISATSKEEAATILGLNIAQ